MLGDDAVSAMGADGRSPEEEPMKIRKSLGWTAAILLLALLGSGCADPEGGSRDGAATAPPVVLITVDGLVASELAAFGGERSAPALESLVASAQVWNDSWTACPMTRPAVATYLTGLAPDRHRVTDDLDSPLPEDLPTLATLLAERGYATAAFPASSLLGADSGLLRDFEIVDDPPPQRIGPDRRVPTSTRPSDTADHFALWLESLPEDAPYFAWLHFSAPLHRQFLDLGKEQFGAEGASPRARAKGKAGGKTGGKAGEDSPWKGTAAPPGDSDAEDQFDAALGRVIAALEVRGDANAALVVLAPTMGDIGGGDSEPPGAGFSLAERAIRVPLVVRFPAANENVRGGDQPAWAPDVAATIAGLTTVTLQPLAEGISLLESPAEERTLFSWSWATRDQMGWQALRAARSGAWKRSEGLLAGTTRLDGAEGEPAAEMEEALTAALESRAEPARVAVELAEVVPWLEAHGLRPVALPAEGRSFGGPAERRQVAALLWLGRHRFSRNRFVPAIRDWEAARDIDPENRAALLALGQARAMGGSPEAAVPLRRAAELYPGDFDVLHWLGHALWDDSWRDVKQLLVTILPHRPYDTDVLYDLACTRSLDGDPAGAVEYLKATLKAGFRNWDLIESDPDLRNLRETPSFSELLREYGR
jgi:arylsulfatase A-like enzyme